MLLTCVLDVPWQITKKRQKQFSILLKSIFVISKPLCSCKVLITWVTNLSSALIPKTCSIAPTNIILYFIQTRKTFFSSFFFMKYMGIPPCLPVYLIFWRRMVFFRILRVFKNLLYRFASLVMAVFPGWGNSQDDMRFN